jgi:hypothetical protein
MNMTKRDIGDIVLVWMAVSFLMSLLTSIYTLGTLVGMTQEAKQYIEKSVAVPFKIFEIIVLLFLNYVLLFKRSLILSLVFPDGKEKEISVPSGLTVLTFYAFWIRLLGIFTFLSSGIRFIGRLTLNVSANLPYVDVAGLSWMSWMYRSGVDELVSVILAAFVIWKADWIAERIGKIGSSNKASEAASDSAEESSAPQG